MPFEATDSLSYLKVSECSKYLKLGHINGSVELLSQQLMEKVFKSEPKPNAGVVKIVRTYTSQSCPGKVFLSSWHTSKSEE